MNKNTNPEDVEVGVVGLGLMGSSIVVALLVAGHKVKAIAPRPVDLLAVGSRINDQLNHCRQLGLVDPGFQLEDCALEISQDYQKLKCCRIVFECVIEDVEIKASIYNKITDIVQADTIIATNTSAISITTLQGLVAYPERFMGIHWSEPAYATRFMEITCGAKTCSDYAEWVFDFAGHWRKEPTLLRKDIRGFITNRLMYAVYRELFHLIDQGRISIEDADKAFRYDAGSWITMMGVFRRMDFMGLKDWATILTTILPTLSNKNEVPAMMQEMVNMDARGIHNLKGLYSYTAKEAKEWEDAFTLFNKDIFDLAALYPSAITASQPEFIL